MNIEVERPGHFDGAAFLCSVQKEMRMFFTMDLPANFRHLKQILFCAQSGLPSASCEDRSGLVGLAIPATIYVPKGNPVAPFLEGGNRAVVRQ